ncbi:MAG TPA: MFS transporter, partial [Kineosporiaceae bacterium]
RVDVMPSTCPDESGGPTGSGGPGRGEVLAAARATSVAFIATGFAFASWASRIPQVRDRLHLDPAELGLVLLAIAAGALIALPLSGSIVGRFGSRRTVQALALVDGVAVAVVAVGYRFDVVPVLVGLFLFGFAQGGWDVAMNVQGAAVERRLGRSIMPRFHAGFSVGTVAGALIGAAMVALSVPVTVHLLPVGALVATVVPVSVRRFVPDADDQAVATAGGRSPRALSAWREPRTVLVGLLVLVFAFAEGTGNDWTGVGLIDDYHVSPSVGTLGFATFLTAMTVARWVGPAVLDRWGRVTTLRVLAVTGVAGVALLVAGGELVGGDLAGAAVPMAFAGLLLWGLGVSLGFPVGMSAGADQPAMAAPRVSVISSIGYCAFLAGPPAVGFLADRTTVLLATVSVAVLLAVAVLLTAVVSPLPQNDPDVAEAVVSPGPRPPDLTPDPGAAHRRS